MVRSSIFSFIVVAAECPDPSLLVLSWWPRNGPIHHSHYYRGGRGVPRSIILIFIVVAAECPDPSFSLLSWWPRSGPIHYSHFYRGGRGVPRPSILTFVVVRCGRHLISKSVFFFGSNFQSDFSGLLKIIIFRIFF